MFPLRYASSLQIYFTRLGRSLKLDEAEDAVQKFW